LPRPSNARGFQRQGDQPVEELVHPPPPQRHAAADLHVFAQAKRGDRLAGAGAQRLLSRDLRQVLDRFFQKLAVLPRLSHAHAHHNLLQARNRVNVAAAQLLLERRDDALFVIFQ